MTAQQTVKAICEALIEKKGQDIQVLQVERLTELTEYFVICSASSTTQVKALADNVEWHLKYDHETLVHHTEGCWITAAWSCMCSCRRRASSIIWRTCGRTERRCRWATLAWKKSKNGMRRVKNGVRRVAASKINHSL